jgi:hypothetical protein
MSGQAIVVLAAMRREEAGGKPVEAASGLPVFLLPVPARRATLRLP